MTSILTNQGAMVALQTLKSVNNDLGTVQEQISTGKKVGTAKDNSAVWAISKTMEADVVGFSKISEGLAVGESTVAVARDAAESVTDLLTQMKDKIVQSQGDGVDAASKEKIQADITALKEQISSVTGAAQFNGRNLVDGTTPSPMQVMSSLNRDIDGNVKVATIGVDTVDLRAIAVDQMAMEEGVASGSATTGGTAVAIAGGGTTVLTEAAAAEAGADTKSSVVAGDKISITIGDKTVSYTIAEGNTDTDITNGVNAQLLAEFGNNTASAPAANFTYDATTGEVTNSTTDTAGTGPGEPVDISSSITRGALGDMATLDVTTDPKGAMAAIEGLLKVSVNAAAAFGTAQNQIETQSDFVGKLTDNLKIGIGSMVDADMEEASARLQALQTQQQLGIQSLSIANQAPGAVMALFR